MAGVAVHAVVDISVDILVMEVGCVVAPMATGACEDRVIRGVRVASGADRIRIAVIHGEEGVVTCGQGRGQPCSRGVARSACRGPARRHVIRIRGPGEICRVAGVTIRGSPCKHIVDMA